MTTATDHIMLSFFFYKIYSLILVYFCLVFISLLFRLLFVCVFFSSRVDHLALWFSKSITFSWYIRLVLPENRTGITQRLRKNRILFTQKMLIKIATYEQWMAQSRKFSELRANRNRENEPIILIEFIFGSSTIRLSFTISPTCVVCIESLVLRSKTLDGKCAGESVEYNDDFAFINFGKICIFGKDFRFIYFFYGFIYFWSPVEESSSFGANLWIPMNSIRWNIY